MKKRADELLKDKPAVAIEMLRRAVKNGYIAKYLLVDKWFFGHDFIKEVRIIKDVVIHVITLLRNKTTGFTVDGKRISAKVLIQKQERKAFKTCRQYKCLYARVKAKYNGIPVQLFIWGITSGQTIEHNKGCSTIILSLQYGTIVGIVIALCFLTVVSLLHVH